ncbi:MAG: hypothetical protein HKO92_02255 [Flavobacteriaceae bacterium]|nr:hypothetical protein [Flavobacteriaceae bacterium]
MYIVKISQNTNVIKENEDEVVVFETSSFQEAKQHILDSKDYLNSLIYSDKNTIEGITEDGRYLKIEITKI